MSDLPRSVLIYMAMIRILLCKEFFHGKCSIIQIKCNTKLKWIIEIGLHWQNIYSKLLFVAISLKLHCDLTITSPAFWLSCRVAQDQYSCDFHNQVNAMLCPHGLPEVFGDMVACDWCLVWYHYRCCEFTYNTNTPWFRGFYQSKRARKTPLQCH